MTAPKATVPEPSRVDAPVPEGASPIPALLTKKDLRSLETRRALIEAAEALFGENGVDSVSLRQIGSAAGSSNLSVVSYHFGNKVALINAIYHYRLPAVDRRRGELLRAAIADGQGEDCRTLLRCLWLPLFEQRSADGRHGFSRFLSSISKSGLAHTRHAISAQYPFTNEIAERLGIMVRTQNDDIRQFRLHMQFVILAGVIEQIDARLLHDDVRAKAYFEDGLNMATSALTSTT